MSGIRVLCQAAKAMRLRMLARNHTAAMLMLINKAATKRKEAQAELTFREIQAVSMTRTRPTTL